MISKSRALRLISHPYTCDKCGKRARAVHPVVLCSREFYCLKCLKKRMGQPTKGGTRGPKTAARKHEEWLRSQRAPEQEQVRRIINRNGRFSACPVCGDTSEALTRHHLKPDAIRPVGERSRLVMICELCHRFAHKLWGEGHKFTGPMEAIPFIVELRVAVDVARLEDGQ